MTKHFFSLFFKFQTAAIIATLVDFTVTILLTEIAGINYLISTSTGSITGGIVNFLLGRKWVFKASYLPAGRQLFRYLLTWVISILLNITFVIILTELVKFNYIISKIITAVLIGITFNFSMQKRFVFNYNGHTVTKLKKTQP
jgi:putative flippase GtrA